MKLEAEVLRRALLHADYIDAPLGQLVSYTKKIENSTLKIPAAL